MNATECQGKLPNGTLGPRVENIYFAYYEACKLTWGTDQNMNKVKVFYVEDDKLGEEVPSYLYCDDCNYNNHTCPGCGDDLKHEQGSVCAPCIKEHATDEAGDNR